MKSWQTTPVDVRKAAFDRAIKSYWDNPVITSEEATDWSYFALWAFAGVAALAFVAAFVLLFLPNLY